MSRIFTDMMGNRVTVAFPPKRIISLVPSQTELLNDLGLDSEVVGITKFCVHPAEWFRNKKRVGGTKTVHIDIARQLNPDLVIANKEENLKEQVEELATFCPVWISDIHTIQDGLEMISRVGALVDKEEQANSLAKDIADGFTLLQSATVRQRVAYFIWYNPWMTVGHDTFINNMIETMGWENVFKDRSRYPEVTIADLAASRPEIVLLSSEPFPFKEKHVVEVQAALPGTKVMLVDGEMFSWYGSRMMKAIPYLSGLVNNAWPL